MTDDEIEKLAKAIAKATSSGNTGGIGNSNPPSSGGGGGISKTAMEGLNRATGGLASEVSGSAKTWQQASNIGVGFNNDAIGLRTSIAQTRLSTDEWGDSIKKGAVGFTALGGTMTDSAKKFNQMSASFSDTTAADELRKIGFTTKEYNDVLAISLAGKKGQDLATLEGQRKANMAAADLALEMDKVAQLTGVSRREQQEALMEKQKNARVQATIELEIRKGGKDASDAYLNMSTKLKGVGLDKLGDELYTGQALSQKAIAQMNALGPAGNQLREAINATKNARTDEDKQRAQAMMERAQAAIAERQQSTAYLTMVQRGQGEVAEAAGEGMIAARNYNKGIEEVQAEFKAQGKALTTEQAQQVLAQRANKPKDIATGADKTSAEAAAAKTTEAYVLASARAGDGAAKFASAINDANKALTAYNTATRNALDVALAGAANIKPSTQKPGTFTTGRDRLGLANSEGLGRALDAGAKGDFKEAGRQIGVGAVETFRNLKEITTNTIQVIGGVLQGNKPVEKPKFEEGTAGPGFDMNKLVQNFGKATTVELHGEEAVLTKKQLGDLVTGMLGSAKKSKPDDILGSLPKPEDIMAKMPKLEDIMSKMPKPEDMLAKMPKPEDIMAKMPKPEDIMAKMPKPDALLKQLPPVPKIEMPGAANTAQATTKAAEDRKIQDVQRMATELQLEAAKKGVDLTREQAVSQAQDKVAKDTKAAAEAAAKAAEVKAQTERKAYLESAIKNGPADIAENARKELTAMAKAEQENAKKEEESRKKKEETTAKTASVTNTKGATANIKDTKTGAVSNISKTVPNEMAQQRAEEERKRAAAATAPKTATSTTASATPGGKTSTLDDLNEQLKQLNTRMDALISHTAEVASHSERQAKNLKRLDPNVSLRG
jgi:hypothetical protein